MNKKFIIPVLLAAGLVFSCKPEGTESLEKGSDALHGTDQKIVNTITRTGNSFFVKTYTSDAFDTSVPEVVGIARVFTSTPGKEELEKRFGLDRWYEVFLREEADAEEIAREMSADSRVRYIQFDVEYTKASDCVVIPAEEKPATKAAGDVFDDPMLSSQWNYINKGNTSISKTIYKGADINVADVWSKLTTGDNSIVVAVIDEGVKNTHPDLKDNIWTNSKEIAGNGIDDDGNGYVDDVYGYNFVNNTGTISWDKVVYNSQGQNVGDVGHGTHCAGTIAAVNNNKVGVSGIAGGSGNSNGVKIMSCQIFSGGASASSSATAKAFKYAADNGASVASCSFGYTGGTYTSDNAYLSGNGGSNRLEADAIHYFEASKNNSVLDGGVVIFASGNDGKDYAEYPGALHDIISVSAFGPDYLPAYYTNYGPGCNIVAPGGEYYHLNADGKVTGESEILSTVPSEIYKSDYGYMQGTSMACPHVAGIAALGLSYAKQLGKTFTVQEFKNMLLASANDFDSRLQGTKTLSGMAPIQLYKYMKLMGSGSIDTWNFMMKIEGIPSVVVKTGSEQWINVSDWFGTSSVNLTYLGEADDDKVYVDISDADMAALGMSSKPYMKFGKLFIYPTKAGACKLTIRAVAGGTIVGGGDNVGGMEVSQTLSVIARDFKSDNAGWL